MIKVKVYHTKIKSHYSENEFMEYLNTLPNSLQEKILKVKHPATRYSKLFGFLLLQHGLKMEGVNTDALSKLGYTSKGKPFISGDIEFNISHSAEMVVCAISNAPIGVDIEKIRDVNIENFKIYFSDEEYQNLKESSEVNKLFFQYWTRKEAFAKAIGGGLNISFAEINSSSNRIEHENQSWFNHELDVCDGYVGSVCISQPDSILNFDEIYFSL